MSPLREKLSYHLHLFRSQIRIIPPGFILYAVVQPRFAVYPTQYVLLLYTAMCLSSETSHRLERSAYFPSFPSSVIYRPFALRFRNHGAWCCWAPLAPFLLSSPSVRAAPRANDGRGRLRFSHSHGLARQPEHRPLCPASLSAWEIHRLSHSKT